jgi:hypothetical protein
LQLVPVGDPDSIFRDLNGVFGVRHATGEQSGQEGWDYSTSVSVWVLLYHREVIVVLSFILIA